MSEIINIIFDNGLNSLTNIQWELYDTPPARAFRDLTTQIEKSDNHTITETYFCKSSDEAESLWQQIRTDLLKLNLSHKSLQLSYSKLRSSSCLDLINYIHKIIPDIVVYEDRERIKKITKKVMNLDFWIGNGRVENFKAGYEGGVFGRIEHYPTPYVTAPFQDSFYDYFTHDVKFGEICLDVGTSKIPYEQMAMELNFEDNYHNIRSKLFGNPETFSNGFSIYFYEPTSAIFEYMTENCFNNYKEIKRCDPDFDVVHAIKCAGKIPVGRLLTRLGEKGYPGYDDLKTIERLFKIEFFEDY